MRHCAAPTTTNRTIAPRSPCRGGRRTEPAIAPWRAWFHLAVLAIALCSRPLSAQSLEERVRALAQPAGYPLGAGGDAVMDAMEARAQEALASLRHPQSRHEADLARPKLRKQLEDALGLKRFPPPRARNVRRTGVLPCDRIPDRETRIRDASRRRGACPPLRARAVPGPRPGHPVLQRPLVGRFQDAARLPGLLHQRGAAWFCRSSASTRSAKASAASPLGTTAERSSCWWALPSRGWPSLKPSAPWTICCPGRRSTRTGSA